MSALGKSRFYQFDYTRRWIPWCDAMRVLVCFGRLSVTSTDANRLFRHLRSEVSIERTKELNSPCRRRRSFRPRRLRESPRDASRNALYGCDVSGIPLPIPTFTLDLKLAPELASIALRGFLERRVADLAPKAPAAARRDSVVHLWVGKV